MKSVIQGVRDGLFDVAVGLFLLVLCGVSTACGRAPDPQEAVDAVQIKVAPVMTGGVNKPVVNGDFISICKPESAMTVTAEVPPDFTVVGEPGDAYYDLPVGMQLLDAAHRSAAFSVMNSGSDVAGIQAVAIHPLHYDMNFTPTLLVNGVTYTGHMQTIHAAVGD